MKLRLWRGACPRGEGLTLSLALSAWCEACVHRRRELGRQRRELGREGLGAPVLSMLAALGKRRPRA